MISDLFAPDVPTQPIPLFYYQERAIVMLRDAVATGAKAPLLALATGAGKTRIAAAWIQSELDAGNSSLFLAPRRELVHQCSAGLRSFGIRHGVIMAGEEHRMDPGALVHVASVDTMASWARRLKLGRLPAFDNVIYDEAHLSISEIKADLLAQWPDAIKIGLTATPVRKDGKALGILYDRLIEPVTPAELVAQGYLVPAKYYSLNCPDLSGVRTLGGDYNNAQIDAIMGEAKYIGDVVKTFLERAADRRTVVFCCSIAHSIAMCEAFQRAGVAAEHVDADTPHDERARIFARFISGQTQVLTNVYLASYGFDLPELSCVIFARPTKSLMLYLQMLGRALRTAPGKDHSLVLDHSGNVHRFGLATDPRPWTLDGIMSFTKAKERKKKDQKDYGLIECPDCHAMFSQSRICPECGYELRRKGQHVVSADGELVRYKPDAPPPTVVEQTKSNVYRMFVYYGRARGYKDGWATMQYKKKFSQWPPREWATLKAIEPDIETRRWIQAQMIAYRKSQERARA